MRRLLATLALVALLATGALAAVTAAPVAAQTDDGVTTTSAQPGGDIIPEPGSGTEPEDAGDRGGALQTVLFVAIVLAIVAIGALIARQSRKARAGRGF